ncbi:MAG: pyridoxamine kinase [Evtepia sp.]
MRRIVTVQDISCLGKCSLTVALPILSAMGVETAVLPTAVLSAHTAFPEFTFHDLTAEIPKIAAHWKRQNLIFDAIYTGYLGSFDQLKLMSQFVDDFKTEETLIFVDPVMGDHGKLYPGFTEKFVDEMGRFCGKADVIVPNLTEATYLLHLPYPDEQYDEAYIRNILRALSQLGVPKVILTGVSFRKGQVGAMAYDADRDDFFLYQNTRLPDTFHGTGDIFASVCVGGLMNQLTLGESLTLAVDYTLECIQKTVSDPDRRNYGVNFERAIPMLLQGLPQ